MMQASHQCLALIKQFEGFRGDAYLDLVGTPTIGYGFTEGVALGDTMTRAEADQLLRKDLVRYEMAVNAALTLPPNQNELDALVCTSWNIGIAAIRGSSMIKAHNRGDKIAAANAFKLWNKAGGKIVSGLVRRRAAEAALYLTPVEQLGDIAGDMPQAVDAPRSMLQSSMNRASVIAGGSAGLAAAADVANTVTGFKASLEGLGDWLLPALLFISVAACAWLIYERVTLRKEGRL